MIETPGGEVRYDGDARIDGVPGTAAPIPIEFQDIAGSMCGALLPTGNTRDGIAGFDVTCIDNGMPVIVISAASLGIAGDESPKELEANAALREKIEAVRLAAGPLMNLGDVRAKTVPKVSIVSAPRNGGALSTRTFIPHRVHEAIGVFGAVSVAAACVLPGSVAAESAVLRGGPAWRLDIEHPTGFFTVDMEVGDDGGKPVLKRSALLRTARMLMTGQVQVPGSAWQV
jgi:4-oxalomesaconate tautomerase